MSVTPEVNASPWRRSHKFSNASRLIADRHYNRQKVGTPQFVRPARSLVLRAADGGPHNLPRPMTVTEAEALQGS